MTLKRVFTCEKCGREIAPSLARLGSMHCHDHRRTRLHSDGYVLERGGRYQHRLVAETFLGRPLLPGEEIHHRNGIKTDNRPENLQIVSRREHSVLTNGMLTNAEIIERLLLGYRYCDIAAGEHRIRRIREALGLPRPGRLTDRMAALARWEREWRELPEEQKRDALARALEQDEERTAA